MPASSDEKSALLLQLRQTVPGFALPDATGATIRLRAFRQRRPVLLALLHSTTCSDCRAWLPTLSAAREELEYLAVQPLLIFPDDPAALAIIQHELDIPGSLLSDPNKTTRGSYLRIEEPPASECVALIAIGRYNDLLDAWVADEPSHWPSLAEITATFSFAEQEDCACGLPIWPSA
ncbi:MAG TPA: redoxin domain-containing protein [Ktedonobacterales bacterium]|nr:redoxin domain-containing protein [Ktedonobacterales bacterium]